MNGIELNIGTFDHMILSGRTHKLDEFSESSKMGLPIQKVIHSILSRLLTYVIFLVIEGKSQSGRSSSAVRP